MRRRRRGPEGGTGGLDEQHVSGATRVVMDNPELFFLIPVVCTLAYLLYWFNVRHMVRVQVSTILSLLVVPMTIVLMYLPLFRLAGSIELDSPVSSPGNPLHARRPSG